MSLAVRLPPAAEVARREFVHDLVEQVHDRTVLDGVRHAIRPAATADDRATAATCLRLAGHQALAARLASLPTD